MPLLEFQPPDIIQLEPAIRLIFLNGPIQAAPDWQTEAVSIINELYAEQLGQRTMPLVAIANPRRTYVDDTFDYGAQVDWETANRWRAALHGVHLFWLASEASHDHERAYAQPRASSSPNPKPSTSATGCAWLLA